MTTEEAISAAKAQTAPAYDPYAGNMYYGQTENRFTDRFMAHYVSMHTDYWGYREVAYHYDDDGSIDWALISADKDFSSPMPFLCIIGNRVIFHGDYMNPFYSGYAVYDVKTDTFTDALAENYRPTYKGFTEVFDGIRDGRLLGDLDGDDEISIIDATIIQRCDVGLRSYPKDDVLILDGMWYEHDEKTAYYSDFNRDGERDIMDATAIRRYLVHMPYLAE